MWKNKPNKQYNVARAESLPVKVATHQRKKMYELFVGTTKTTDTTTILDVGVTSDQTYESSNYMEAWHPFKNVITAVGIDDAKFLENKYKGVRFVKANGLDMPFGNKSFDVVHSSAVLEHVGTVDNQTQFIKECARVARKFVFITTPNRWFPIEFHTVLPFIHWLPKNWFRRIVKFLGMEFFSHEANLNLSSRHDLLQAALSIEDFDFKVISVSLLGWPSNLILVGRRKP